MVDFGDAYYPNFLGNDRQSVPAGRYTATITDLSISENVIFGNYIADIFKPEYTIDKKEHPPYDGCSVIDNGIFRYKKLDNYEYNHNKNWGYAKFLSCMGLRKKDKEGGQLPFLSKKDINGAQVLIDVFIKKFINDLDSDVSYPVARVIQLQKSKDVPF
jgi:hypothetical protein|tara:strand:+ start:330 stop:806 length:477 start_codon:yes stop_codon:yes gene_type:complete